MCLVQFWGKKIENIRVLLLPRGELMLRALSWERSTAVKHFQLDTMTSVWALYPLVSKDNKGKKVGYFSIKPNIMLYYSSMLLATSQRAGK